MKKRFEDFEDLKIFKFQINTKTAYTEIEVNQWSKYSSLKLI